MTISRWVTGRQCMGLQSGWSWLTTG